jgi:hypothetical protein
MSIRRLISLKDAKNEAEYAEPQAAINSTLLVFDAATTLSSRARSLVLEGHLWKPGYGPV